MSSSDAFDTTRVPDASSAFLVAQIDNLPDEDLQKVISAAVRSYARRAEERDLSILDSTSGVTATEVMQATTAMLENAGLQLFELGMWQAWSGKQ